MGAYLCWLCCAGARRNAASMGGLEATGTLNGVS